MFPFFACLFIIVGNETPRENSKELRKDRKVFSEDRNWSYTSEVASSLDCPASKWRYSVCHRCAFHADTAFKGRQDHWAEPHGFVYWLYVFIFSLSYPFWGNLLTSSLLPSTKMRSKCINLQVLKSFHFRLFLLK